MKHYTSPTFAVVSIKKTDVIVTSFDQVSGNVFNGDITGSTEAARAPGIGFYEDVIYLGY